MVGPARDNQPLPRQLDQADDSGRAERRFECVGRTAYP
jgi:hypothetical protein